jgi:hypothetical protein
MPTKNDFAQDHPLPSFLSKRAGKSEHLPLVATRDRTAHWSRAAVLTSALAGMITAIALLTVGDPVAILAEAKTSLLDIPALRIAFDQPKPAIQSTSTPESPLETVNDALTRYTVATALEPTDQNQAEANRPSTEDLFKQFQAWAAEKDKRARVEPVRLVQDAPEQVDEARPNLQIMKPQRQVWRIRYARAEVRSSQNSKKRGRQARNVRMLVRPVQDAPAQAQPAQRAAASPSAQSFSSRD